VELSYDKLKAVSCISVSPPPLFSIFQITSKTKGVTTKSSKILDSHPKHKDARVRGLLLRLKKNFPYRKRNKDATETGELRPKRA
jgi:hypothetical protein